MREARNRPQRLGRWPAGANNVADLRSLESFERRAVRAAENVDFDQNGRPHRRSGYTLLSAGEAHSLWAPDDSPWGLFVQAGELRRLDDTGEVTAVAMVHPSRRMRFTESAGQVFGSNGAAQFVLDADGIRPWGVEAPAGQPTLTATAAGGLRAGRYQVAVTFIDARGEESGTGKAVVVEIADGGGIAVSAIPQPASASVATIRLYASPTDGEMLYQVMDLPAGAAVASIGAAELAQQGRPIWTQFCERVPPSRLLMAYRGRIWFVPDDSDGTRLYCSLPLQPGLYRPDQGYLPMPGPVADMVPMLDGFFVGTDRQTLWVAGDEPATMTRRTLDAHGMVPGTATRIRGAVFGADASQVMSAVWWSTNGELIRGDASGVMSPVTRGRYALPGHSGGAVLHREVDGISQIVSALAGPKASASGFGARDRAVAEVVRNGITI